METLEHWWNGYPEMPARRDLWLRFNPAGLWEVEARRAGASTLGEFATEAQARRVLTPLVASEGWQRLE